MPPIQPRLPLAGSDQPLRVISPLLELGAWEVLWAREGATLRRVADRFREQPGALPSDLVPEEEALAMAERVTGLLAERGVERFGVRVHRGGEYPDRLRDARHPLEVLYYQGLWNWTEMRSVAVVGSRKASEEGVRRARELAERLVEEEVAVVSGLAEGVDTAAHEAALRAGGVTVAVLGTPLSEAYPRENEGLQSVIAERYVVVSHVPVWRYYQQDWRRNRVFFPQRNALMAALTEATVIVEAGERSGALVQAREALYQGRQVFVLEECFGRGLDWPERLVGRGAVRVGSVEEIREGLGERAADSG